MKNKHKKKKIVYIICLIFFIALFLFSIINLIFYTIDTNQNKKENDDLIEEVVTTDENNTNDISIDFDKLLSKNPDTVGWIKYNQDKINYPIVKGKDNDFYLKNGFNKEINQAGAIFMDYRNNNLYDYNTIIYGHAMRNGSMFGSLRDVFKNNFFDKRENNYIQIFDKNNTLITYQIFSYYITEEDDYITTTFNSVEQYSDFISTIKNRSLKNFDIKVDSNDKILTLSTCTGIANSNKRRVIHAVKIDNG